jgi:hypothetical protein
MSTIEKNKSSNFDNGPIGSDGQYRDYAVLPQSERDKGFVRPVRKSYVHVGKLASQYPLRDLTEDEKTRFEKFKYVKFEKYPESESSITGRYWTQEELDKIGKGCGVLTVMSTSIAETYARDPKYYGSTFCCGCKKHVSVDEFIWDGTQERVGS